MARRTHFGQGGHADPGVGELAVRALHAARPARERLQAHGHEVTVATEPAFGATVRSHRLEPVPVGRDLTLEDVLGALPDIFVCRPKSRTPTLGPGLRRAAAATNVVDDLLASRRPGSRTSSCGKARSSRAWAVGTRLEIPQVSVNVGAATSAEAWEAFAGTWSATLARRVGPAICT